MAGGWLARRLAAMVVAGWICGIVLSSAADAQGSDNLARLHAEVSRLLDQGRYAEALPIAERALALARVAHGEEHTAVGQSLNSLAVVYHSQGRTAEAASFYKRSLAIYERALGPGHPSVGTMLNNLAGIHHKQGRYGEAEPLYKRSLAIAEKTLGPKHPNVVKTLNNLAGLYQAQGRYADAEPLFKRSLTIREKELGLEHLGVWKSLDSLAEVYEAQGRYGEAERVVRRDPLVPCAFKNFPAHMQRRGVEIQEPRLGAEILHAQPAPGARLWCVLTRWLKLAALALSQELDIALMELRRAECFPNSDLATAPAPEIAHAAIEADVLGRDVRRHGETLDHSRMSPQGSSS